MRENILLRTNLLVCLVIVAGFLLTAVLSYRANYSASLQNIEQVSTLTSEGIYYQLTTTFTKPVNVSLTMANDSLLVSFLSREKDHLEDADYIDTIRDYLNAYRVKYDYDSVFLVSTATGRYYNFNGLDRVLTSGNPENVWYYDLLNSDCEYAMNVDNDEVQGANNDIAVFVNCKVKNDAGAIVGIVGVGLRIDSLQALLKDYGDEFDVDAFLVDESGVVEISTQYTGYEHIDLFDIKGYGEEVRNDVLGWREEGMAASFWTQDRETGKRQDYVVTRYLPELSWHLVVERNTADMVANLNRQLALTMGIILIIIATILFVITCVIRSFNRQIVSLTQAVEQERRTVFEKATEELFDNIYELDITHNRPANRATEQYFESLGAPADTPYDKALHIIAEKQIKAEFRQGYLNTFRPENVLRAYEAGQESLRYDFLTSTGGDYFWMRITARIVRWESDDSIHMLVYRQNIDVEKRQEDRMQALAQTDEMTGLSNKAATPRRIERLLREAPEREFAFFIFDIDTFKQANDQFGHAFGDSVIVAFAQILRANFRKDDVLGRIGGDEFVAFIAVSGREWAREKARALSAALDRIHEKDGKRWKMSASIGVAFAPRDGADFDTLYKKADAALYQTKARGRNGFSLYGEGEAR